MHMLGSSYSTPPKANIFRGSKDSHSRILGNLDVLQSNLQLLQGSHEKEGYLVFISYGDVCSMHRAYILVTQMCSILLAVKVR